MIVDTYVHFIDGHDEDNGILIYIFHRTKLKCILHSGNHVNTVVNPKRAITNGGIDIEPLQCIDDDSSSSKTMQYPSAAACSTFDNSDYIYANHFEPRYEYVKST